MITRVLSAALITLAGLLASLVIATTTAGAAPVVAPGQGEALTSNPLVQVHYCHRGVRIGPVTGVPHRHVGPGCRPVRARVGACARWRRICARRCFEFGAPFPGRCRAICFRRNAPRFCF